MPHLTKEAREALPDECFALPHRRDLPLHDPHHVSMAWAQIDNIKCSSDAERVIARSRIKTAATRFDMDIGEEPATGIIVDYSTVRQWGNSPKVPFANMSLLARSLDIPTDPHPNKLPFSGVLTKLEEPSDAAPEGSGGKRIMLTRSAAENALDSLLGMAVDFCPEFDGHDPQAKIGVITGATIDANEIRIHGFIYAADFPDVAKEIKANKDQLGFSFEAKNLWTSDPEADPVPIAEMVFTGAAILLKDKAAYHSTSISAAKATNQEGFIMDENTKVEFAALLADALKPLTEKVEAQAATIKKMEEDKVQAANLLPKIEPYAVKLENCAAAMEDAGMGGHPSRGHAAVLRDMAGKMRAEAATGKMPHVYETSGWMGASVEKTEKVDVDAVVKAAVEKATAEFTKQVADMKAAAEKAQAEVEDARKVAETKLADMKSAAEKEEAKSVAAPERKTLAPGIMASLTKHGVELPTDDSKLDMTKINEAFAKAHLTSEKRIELKNALFNAGLIEK